MFHQAHLELGVLTLSVLSCLHAATSETSNSYFRIEGINYGSHVIPGDIQLVYFSSIYRSTLEGREQVACDSFRMSVSTAVRMKAVEYAIHLVNSDPALLPHARLGAVFLDTCSHSDGYVAQALTLIPRTPSSCGVNRDNGSSLIFHSSSSPSASSSSSETSENALPYYDVVAAVGIGGSTSAIALSRIMAVAQIPIIASMASSDDLSDKYNFPYFTRVIPPDKFQVHAIISFILKHGWTYISVIYSGNNYGQAGFDNIKSLTSEVGICIATSHKIISNTDYGYIARDLLQHYYARVVIIFTGSSTVRGLLDEIILLNASDHFVWVGSDGWAASATWMTEQAPALVGAFTFSFFATPVPDFECYLKSDVANEQNNQWIRLLWEHRTNCSFTENTCRLPINITELEGFKFYDSNSNLMDSVLTLAHAIHNLVQSECPEARGAEVRACIKGPDLLRYLKNATFQGFTGWLQFDQNGDQMGRYQIKQVVYEDDDASTGTLVEVPVAVYDIRTKFIDYYKNKSIVWDYFGHEERLLNTEHEFPESVCSRPCSLGEFRLQKELPCCWECRLCRDNERVVNDGTACQICPRYTWPDLSNNLTTCSDIPLSYPAISDTLPIIQLCLGVIAILGTGVVTFAYVHLRDVKVIKAASRELSFFQLVAIFFGYITVIVFQTTPTDVTCSALYFLFCLSFTWLYSPLLVKAVRIYRIFQSGIKHNRRPRFVSPRSQLVLACILIIPQVTLCVCVALLYKPSAALTQAVLTEKYVELSCDLTFPGLTSFLAYNLVLICLCSFFAFKTRKLPDNFNESRFITMCVSTALVIWLAFVPAYFTAGRQFVRVLLLSAALLINHTVALLFLFLPKIYAAVYLTDEETHAMTHRFQSTFTTRTMNITATGSNRVAPVPPSLSS